MNVSCIYINVWIFEKYFYNFRLSIEYSHMKGRSTSKSSENSAWYAIRSCSTLHKGSKQSSSGCGKDGYDREDFKVDEFH